MAYVVGGEERNLRGIGECAQLAVHALLVGIEMALEIDEEILRAKDCAQTIGEGARIIAANQRARDGTARATDEADEAGAETIEVIEGDAALALGGIDGRVRAIRQHPHLSSTHLARRRARVAPLFLSRGKMRERNLYISSRRAASRTQPRERTALRSRQHPAEILVALAIGHEDVEAAVVLERQVGADDRLEAGFLRGLIKARMTIDTVAIAHRKRGIAEFRRAICQILGRSGAFEEAESSARAQFDVSRIHRFD